MVVLREVLARNLFQSAVVAAGHKGLDRPVQWVHIGEIPNIGDFLRGGELVLSTGVGLTTPEQRRMFVQGLVKAKASGLVLELGEYFPRVPQDLVDTANADDLPLIVFAHPVRFLDLSQEVNSLLLSRHHRILEDLDDLSGRLRKVLLATMGLPALFQASYDVLKQPLGYIPRDPDHDAAQFGLWPFPLRPFRRDALHPLIEQTPAPNLRQTISVFGYPVGDVVILLSADYLDEYLYLALDRITTAAAQEIIRVETLEKHRRQEEAVLLEQLFFEDNPPAAVLQRCRSRYNLSGTRSFRVGVVPRDARASAASAALNRLPGLYTTACLKQSDRDIWLVIGRSAEILKLPEALAHSFGGRECTVGLSAPHNDPAEIHTSFAEAYDAAQVAGHVCGASPQSYEKLGAYRWLLATAPDVLQRLVIHPELDALLESEHSKSADALLLTLEALLTLNGSKQDVSTALGIHRQTLYSRIRTLKALLGEDFMVFERRVALENAILAYRFLCSQQHEDPLPAVPKPQ